MRVIVDNVAHCTTEPDLKYWLPSSLFSQAPKDKHRLQWLASRVLLAKSVNRGPLAEMALDENKKPYFTDKTLPHFNISHCQDYIAIALSDLSPIGCDIEVIRPRNNLYNIIKAYFTADEIAYFNQLPTEAITPTFFKIWTLKEAYLKQQGLGIWAIKQAPSLHKELQQYGLAHYQLSISPPICLSVCSGKEVDISNITLINHVA